MDLEHKHITVEQVEWLWIAWTTQSLGMSYVIFSNILFIYYFLTVLMLMFVNMKINIEVL